MTASISDTFPMLDPAGGLADALKPLGLTPLAPLVELLSLGERSWEAYEALAAVLLDECGTVPLEQSIPSLWQASDSPLPVVALRPRIQTRLCGKIEGWSELVARSPADLSDTLSLYQTQLVQLVALAVQRGATYAAQAAPRSPERPHTVERPAKELRGQDVVARWAQVVAAAITVGDAIEAIATRQCPEDVAEAFTALQAMPLSAVSGIEGADAFAASFRGLIEEVGGAREVTVLRERLRLKPATLETLGDRLGITRERVRQLQLNGERKLRERVQTGAHEVRWRALQLRDELGTSIRLESRAAQDAIERCIAGLPEAEREFATTLLLWLAGPYRLDRDTGWVHVGKATIAGPPLQQALLEQTRNGSRCVEIEELRDGLSKLGFTTAAQEDWLEHYSPLRKIGDSYFVWGGTVADKAEMVLEALTVPLTAEQINELIGEGHNTRGLRGRLLGDERFVRTDKLRIGLRAWGLNEYTGIVDEIDEEIERLGGEADVRVLIATIAERFELPATSVEVYTGVPRFLVSDGRIRLRLPDEPYVPSRAVEDEPACYVLDDSRCTFRFQIDRDTLRGSGRPIPQGLGAWLGVMPGSREQFATNEGNVLVSWPDSALLGPSLGSVRRPIVAAGGVEGDYALLIFDRRAQTLGVTIVTAEALKVADNLERFRLCTGIDATTEDELEAGLADAVGAVTITDLRGRLRARGESELVGWLPYREDPELDEALNRLRAVL